MPTLEQRLEAAIRAAMAAGRHLMAHRAELCDLPATQRKESARDIASAVDLGAEQAAFAALREADPRAGILAEEHGQLPPALAPVAGTPPADDADPDDAGQWLVDALDGTVNYLHQVPFFCVSIAWVHRGRARAAAVYAPLVDDIYYAADGLGAFKNQHRLRTPDRDPEDSLFAATFSGRNHDPARRLDEFALFARVNDASRGCLRTGSAALNLAYLAEGRFNGCWGKANKRWDIAAGLLIAEQAGAQLSLVAGDAQQQLQSYLAAPPRNHAWLAPQVLPLFDAATALPCADNLR